MNNNSKSNEELNLLYSCSRWAGYDPQLVLQNFIKAEQNAYAYMKEHYTVEEDIPYGTEENQKVDIWGTVGDKLFIFLHGGYWQEGDRKHILSPATKVAEHMAFASLGYSLATPPGSLTQTVTDVLSGVKFLISRYPQVTEIVLGGHSAGAHLAYQTAVRLRHPKIKKLVLMAAVFQLEELVFCEIGQAIRLTTEEAKDFECDPRDVNDLNIKILLLNGLKDSPRLIEQNKTMYSAIKMARRPYFNELISCDHFNLISRFQDKKSEQTQILLHFLGLAPESKD